MKSDEEAKKKHKKNSSIVTLSALWHVSWYIPMRYTRTLHIVASMLTLATKRKKVNNQQIVSISIGKIKFNFDFKTKRWFVFNELPFLLSPVGILCTPAWLFTRKVTFELRNHLNGSKAEKTQTKQNKGIQYLTNQQTYDWNNITDHLAWTKKKNTPNSD